MDPKEIDNDVASPEQVLKALEKKYDTALDYIDEQKNVIVSLENKLKQKDATFDFKALFPDDDQKSIDVAPWIGIIMSMITLIVVFLRTR